MSSAAASNTSSLSSENSCGDSWILETVGGCDDLLNTLLSSDGIVESFESGINGNGKCCAVGLVGW